MQFLVPSKFNPNPTALAVQNAWCSKVLNPTEQQGRQESNPQPPVLETGALPIELHPFMTSRGQLTRDRRYCKSIGPKSRLLDDLGDNTRSDRLATFANRESDTFVNRNCLLQFDDDTNVVPGHAHFGPN